MKRLTPRQYGVALVSLLEEAAAAKRPALIRAFLTSLRRRRHWRLLPAIIAAAERERLLRTGTVLVQAVTARPLPPNFPVKLGAVLKKIVSLDQTVEPALTVGLKLTIGERLLDSSLPTLLRQLRRRLVRD